jgi:hypothetical protein
LAVVGTVPTVAVVPPKQRGVLLTLYNSTPHFHNSSFSTAAPHYKPSHTIVYSYGDTTATLLNLTHVDQLTTQTYSAIAAAAAKHAPACSRAAIALPVALPAPLVILASVGAAVGAAVFC